MIVPFALAMSLAISPVAPVATPSPAAAAAQESEAAPDSALAVLTSHAYLSEITRYLYRWHLDEKDLLPEVNRGEFVFWVRELDIPLDPGDRSEFAEITLPRLGIRVDVKKSDYEIPELDLHVENDQHQIMSVEPVPVTEAAAPEGVQEVRIDYPVMRDELFKTRSRVLTADEEFLDFLRRSERQQLRNFLEQRGEPLPTEPQEVHLAPLSSVANDVWAFWEEGRLLIRFQSDMDLEDRDLWDHMHLDIEVYHLDEQVVVSLDEVAGSNAYVTRDMVGRALFNCVVLGRRITLEIPGPGDDEGK